MLFSIALIVISSLIISQIFQLIKLPRIIGLLLTGIILGPFVLDLISPDILNISIDLRQIALIVILIRAGLSLDIEDLKKAGRPAILLSFVPATIEMIAITIFAPILFHISYLDAALMGAVVAAVSPAVVLPRMIHLLAKGHGTNKKIPQMLLAGSSVENIIMITVFTSLIQVHQGGEISFLSLLNVPVSIILGFALGVTTGIIMVKIFIKFHIRDTVKVLVIFSIGFLFVVLEHALSGIIPLSGLLAVMTLGGTILKLHGLLAKRLVSTFEKIWVIVEIMLFVLVGAAVDISVMIYVGLVAILLIFTSMFFRMIGVAISLIKTPLNLKERIFVGFLYMPKATVQAAISSIPLALGLSSGLLILNVAVLAIMITAPIGAILMDTISEITQSYKYNINLRQKRV
ncbi:MAG: cation:proton antiporter [Firmicutes bacterium]|nr:cation:proton antiporter [Bacillota bacterium]